MENQCKLDIKNCRGQSYDNAANMSGKYNGMQQRIQQISPYAIYIPCAAHSLNLVGRSAVDCCLIAVNFFATVQQIYKFFAASTHRWAVLKQHAVSKNVVKSLSDTRWEAHAAATNALYDSYHEIIDALEEIASDQNQKGDTVRDATTISEKMQEFEFSVMLCLWCEILKKFKNTSKTLQTEDLDLSTCANLYMSLSNCVSLLRDDFDKIEEEAKIFLPQSEYKANTTRAKRRKIQPNDGNAAEVKLSPRENFRINTFLAIIDKLDQNLRIRGEIYTKVSRTFDFLIDRKISIESCVTLSDKLISSYPDDLNSDLSQEVQHYHIYLNNKFPVDKKLSHYEMYRIIVEDNIKNVFPNVEISLQIFLSLMITNCSAERSFSQLKFIKNPKRSTMRQERLDSLSLLCIESDILRRITFEDVIDEFARQKSRLRQF